MTDLFKCKDEMTGASGVQKAVMPASPYSMGTSQSLRALRESRMADDNMSVQNLNRPRRGHDM
jgi:hypothetical protein